MTTLKTLGARRLLGRVPLAWAGGLIAASVLVLGVNGTLSSWSAAILKNNTNTAITSNAVVLTEQVTGSSTINTDCVSSNGGFSNTSTCTEINKYGGTATPLAPNGTQGSTVTFTNTGSEAGTSFKLLPQACASTPNSGNSTTVNLCSSSDLTLTMKCYSGTAASGTQFTDLAYSGTLANFASSTTLTHTTGIAQNGAVTCSFSLALSASANPQDGGITVSQPLWWELDGA